MVGFQKWRLLQKTKTMNMILRKTQSEGKKFFCSVIEVKILGKDSRLLITESGKIEFHISNGNFHDLLCCNKINKFIEMIYKNR